MLLFDPAHSPRALQRELIQLWMSGEISACSLVGLTSRDKCQPDTPRTHLFFNCVLCDCSRSS